MATDDSHGGVRHCYYALLEVEQTASHAELKTAYRRLALRWHPDKNPPEHVQEATQRFRQIQNAYEILSDPRKRAWYDENRERILSGGGGDAPMYSPAPEARVVSVFEYFPDGCYQGYGDGPAGFFGVYTALFNRLAEEAPDEMPGFGRSDSDYNTVVGPFYSRWSQFSSAAATAGNPKRSEEVRVFVAFVKVWDPRVFAHRAEAASALLTGLAEAEELQATIRQSALGAAAVGLGAAVSAVATRSGGLGLALGAALAGLAFAVVTRGSFVSLPAALRQMPPEKRARLTELTLEALGEANALETAAWASLLATDRGFRSRLLAQAREFVHRGDAEVRVQSQ